MVVKNDCLMAYEVVKIKNRIQGIKERLRIIENERD